MANSGNRAYPHYWYTLFQAALLEFDLDKLPQRIIEAQHAVMDQIGALNGRKCGSESEALMNALNVLRELQKMAESVQVARDSGDAQYHPMPIDAS